MLLTVPFANPSQTQSQLLNSQYKRLTQQALTSYIADPSYWMGYITAYTSASFKNNKPYRYQQYEGLFQAVKMIIQLRDRGIITEQNVYEIFSSAVFSGILQSNSHNRNGLDIDQLRDIIGEYTNEVSQNKNFLKNKFFREDQMIKKQVKNETQPKIIQTKDVKKQVQIPKLKQIIFKKQEEKPVKLQQNERIQIKQKKETKKKIKKTFQYQMNGQWYDYEAEEDSDELEFNPQVLQQNEQQLIRFYMQQHAKKSDVMIPTNKKQSIEKFQCPICLEQVSEEDICKVSCGHKLHKNCFIEHFKSRIESKKLPITCTEAGCEKQVQIKDFQAYIPKELIEKYYQFSLHSYIQKNSTNTSWCPTAGCKAVFQFQNDLRVCRCPNCKKNYCLKCKSESHRGSCKAIMSKQDKDFLKFAQGSKMKQCPSCKFWVQKNKGCDHMTCRCGYEFCYVCGAKHGTCSCNPAFFIDEEQDRLDLLRERAPRLVNIRPPNNRRNNTNPNPNNINRIGNILRNVQPRPNNQIMDLIQLIELMNPRNNHD